MKIKTIRILNNKIKNFNKSDIVKLPYNKDNIFIDNVVCDCIKSIYINVSINKINDTLTLNKDFEIIELTEEQDLCLIKKIIGFNIKKYRKQNNLSLEALAKKIDITAQQLFKYENGTNIINIVKLYHIQKELNIETNDLLPKYIN